MGVKGLSNFIKRRFRHWKRVNYKGKVIVDGNSVCYSLYRDIPWALGGEYDKFALKVEDFFTSYFRGSIVILDGSRLDNSKNETAFARRKAAMASMEMVQKSCQIDTSSTSTDGLFPSLVLTTFMATLEQLNIEYYVADGESDQRIAALAEKYKCPVLSADSDFFIFNLRHGFVHFGRLLSSTRPLYYIKDFMKQFKLQTYELCLMIPAYFGNDFIEPEAYGKVSCYGSFLDKLSKCETCAHFKRWASQGRRTKSSNIMRALRFYSDMATDNHYSDFTPQWLYSKYKEGKFSAVLFEAVLKNTCLQPRIVETIGHEAAWNISRPIRHCIYGILNLEDVTEISRANGKAHLFLEAAQPLSLGIPTSVDRVPLNLVLCCLLRVEVIPDEFYQLDDKWKLPIAATCFWYKSLLNPPLLLALLLSFVTLHEHFSRQHFGYAFVVEKKKPDYLEALHAYAKWQCVYSDAISLNSLAVEPMRIINPALLYSGELAMGYALKCGLLLRGSGPTKELLRSFWTIITGTDLPRSS